MYYHLDSPCGQKTIPHTVPAEPSLCLLLFLQDVLVVPGLNALWKYVNLSLIYPLVCFVRSGLCGFAVVPSLLVVFGLGWSFTNQWARMMDQ